MTGEVAGLFALVLVVHLMTIQQNQPVFSRVNERRTPTGALTGPGVAPYPPTFDCCGIEGGIGGSLRDSIKSATKIVTAKRGRTSLQKT